MKKPIVCLSLCVLASLMGAMYTGCNDKDADKKEKSATETTKKKATPANLPNYRYVDSDTILSQYNLSKDYQEEMLRLQSNYDNTARQRENAIQNLANQVQNKAQNNGYLSESSYKQDMNKLQQMQSSAQNELGKMQMNMQNSMMEAQKTVNDSIINYINEYNKSHGYDAIFMKAATLYINPDLDITDEIVKGLNERYNKVKK